MKKSLQTYYGHDSIGFDRFDRKHPADVVMGHSVTLNTLQPVPSGLRVRYTTMLRSPYAWYVSLSRAGANFFGRRGFGWAERHSRRYLHIHDHTMKEPVGRPYDPGFLERAIETCPGLLRDSNDTQCDGWLKQSPFPVPTERDRVCELKWRPVWRMMLSRRETKKTTP